MDTQIYNKFACWCEKATGKKAASIMMAQEKIKELAGEILELKGSVAKLTSEVSELTGDIADNEKEQKEATELRGKENAEFSAEKAELDQAIGACEKAMHVLSDGGRGAGLLQSGNA